MAKNVEIPVIRFNFVGNAVWFVPLVYDGLYLILPSLDPESNGALISFSARITFHSQVHE